MKRMHETHRITELLIKAGLVAAIVGALLMPASIKANGANPVCDDHMALAPTLAPSSPRPLPPIVHLDAMPRPLMDRPQQTYKIDTLLVPYGPYNGVVANSLRPPTGITFTMPNVSIKG